MKSILHSFLLLYLVGFTQILFANPGDTEPSLPILSESRLDAIGEFPRFWVDPTANSALEDYLSEVRPRFNARKPSFGWSDNVVWLESSFRKLDTSEFIIEIAYPLLDQVDLFVFRDGVKVDHFLLGDSVGSTPRALDHLNPSFELAREPGEYRLILRIKSSSSIQAPLNVYRPASFTKQAKEELFATGIYVGILGIMAVYNGFIFLASKQKAYLFYTAFVVSFLLLQLSLSGHTSFYLWPSQAFLSDHMICQGGLIATFFMLAFANHFLGIYKEPRTKSFKAIAGLRIAILAILVISFAIPYVIAIKLMAVSALVSVLVVLSISSYLMFQGRREAIFYFSAWSIFIVACVVYLLKQFGLLPVNIITHNAFKIGSVLEVALLSVALADKLNVMRRALSKNNAQLKDLNENLEFKVQEKTRDIRSILATIPQGVFEVRMEDSKILIDGEYSDFLLQMLSRKEIRRTNPLETIFEPSGLSSDEVLTIDTILQSSIGEDEMCFYANEHSLPKEMNLNARILEIEWTPVISARESIIEKLLITLKDVTDIRKYQQEAMAKQQELVMIGQIVKHDMNRFSEFLRVCEDLFTSAEGELTKLEAFGRIFRNMHTIKGLSRSFDLKKLTDQVHHVEKLLASSQMESVIDPKVESEFKEAFAIFRDYKRINDKVLGRESLQDKLLMNRRDLEEIVGEFRTVKDLSSLQRLEAKIAEAFGCKLSTVLNSEVEMLSSISERLSKPVPQVLFYDEGVIVPDNLRKPIRMVFVHLFRNSIDHGIELPDERQKLDKPVSGVIEVHAQETDARLIIEVFDDGSGVALDKLLEKAKLAGVYLDKTLEELAIQQLIDLVFLPGLSTANQVTDVSGRGVGMDAVQAFVEQSGGKIRVEALGEISAANRQTVKFVMELPLELESPEEDSHVA